MTQSLGALIKEARLRKQLSLRRLADQVIKEDGTPISVPYLNDIESHHRVPSLHVLHELARVLDLNDEQVLLAAGAGVAVVREYLEANPQHHAAVLRLFRVVQEKGFTDWDQLLSIVERSQGGQSEPRGDR